MTVANVRCVLFPGPQGKRLRVIPAAELLALLRKGQAVQIGDLLWEVLDQPAEEVPETPKVAEKRQPPPPPPPRHNNDRKNKHGSRAK